MKDIYRTFRPKGFGTVSPYLFVKDPAALIDFLKNAFYAEEIRVDVNPYSHEIANAILKIGDSGFMISTGKGEFAGMRTALYLFTDNVERMHQNALKYGAREAIEPSDMPYGERQSGIIDPAGNYWWISKRVVKTDYEEEE